MQNDFILTITNEGNALTIEKNNHYTVIYENNTEWNRSVCLLLVKYPALLPCMDSLFRSHLVYLFRPHLPISIQVTPISIQITPISNFARLP